MAERIYIRDDKGGLEPLEEMRFSTENDLQTLIAEHPELLDGTQIQPEDPRRWILITREKGIPETADTASRWAVDHLIVDQDAMPTLVEVKRGSNPEIRRTIVGQMLEYAAHAAQTWSAEDLRRTFQESATDQGLDPDEAIGALLQADGEPDVDRFWQDVSTNLEARRLRLLFVADEIPDPLERTVEFLNAQMPNIEALAVEIKQFPGRSTLTLVPRVIGRTAKSTTSGNGVPKLTRDAFLSQFSNDEARDVAARLLDVAEESGAVLNYGKAGVAIRIEGSRWKNPLSVAWISPPGKRVMGRLRNCTFGITEWQASATDEESRVVLQRWVDGFSENAFATAYSRGGIVGWEIDYEDAALHIDLLAERLANVIGELKAL